MIDGNREIEDRIKIHVMWFKDEEIRKIFIELLIIIRVNLMKELKIKHKMIMFLYIILLSRLIGITFWIDRNSIIFSLDIFFVISIIHLWKGKDPTLAKRDSVIRLDLGEKFAFIVEFLNFIEMDIKIIRAGTIWIIMYSRGDSKFLFLDIVSANRRELISIIIHSLNHEFDPIDIIEVRKITEILIFLISNFFWKL